MQIKLRCSASKGLNHLSETKLSLQGVIGLARGLWSLLHYQCWVLGGTPVGYPFIDLCRGDPLSPLRAAYMYREVQDHLWEPLRDHISN